MNFPASFTVISDEVSQDLPDLIRFVKEFNLPGIELRSMFGRAFKDLTPADIAEIKRVARGEGWRIFGCASPVFKCDIDDAGAVRAHGEEFKRAIGIAAELNCDLVRVFTFLRRPPQENFALLPRVAEHLQKLRSLAGGSSVRIGVENEHSCVVATGEEITGLFARLPDPQFGIVWDPCNILYVPGTTGSPTTSFASLRPRLFHIHIKDATRSAPSSGSLLAQAAPVGAGDVGWAAHLAEIRKSNYRGMLSLETHWRKEQIAEELLHLPAGYAFSKGGEDASRICLRTLRELAASVR